MRNRLCRSGGILVVLVGAALATSGCTQTPVEKSAKHMAAGKKLMEKRDAARAILQFRNAAKLTPDDPEAYYQLGIAHLALSDTRNGVLAIRKALELNPKHAAARLRLAELMGSVGDAGLLQEARKRLEALLQDSPNDPTALHALGLTELRLGDVQNAAEHLESAAAAAPGRLGYAIAVAQARLAQQDVKGAEAVLLKACADTKDSADAWVTLGRFYGSQRRPAEAEQQFQRALAIDANHPGALLNQALLQKTGGRMQEAEQTFKRLAGLTDRTYRHAYALFLYEGGRHDESIQELERLSRNDPEDRAARTRLMVAYTNGGRLADSEKLLAGILKKNPKDLEALLQRAELYIGAKKYAEAEADLNRVLHFQPDSPEAHYALSKLHGARGEVLQQRQDLSEALRLNPFLLPVRVELARLLVATKAPTAALDVLSAAPESQKEALLTERNWALWAAGDYRKMRESIDAALSRGRGVEALVQDGLWKLSQGNPSGARASLEEALKINPGDMRALEALARSYTMQKQTAAAVEKVKEYAALQPKSAPVQEFLGLFLWANQDLAGARRAFVAAKTADPNFRAADLSLVQVEVMEKNWEAAESKLRDLVNVDTQNARAHLWLGNIQELRGEHRSAANQFRKVVELEPNNANALNNLAYLMTEHENKPDEALRYAQKAQELTPDDPDAADTVGWILYRKGLYSAAVQQLERAAAKGENVVWKYHLAMAYAKAGDVAKGRTMFQTALKRNPNVPEAAAAKQLFEETR
jgi:tetratricopeptide (TPR) repeat protein